MASTVRPVTLTTTKDIDETFEPGRVSGLKRFKSALILGKVFNHSAVPSTAAKTVENGNVAKAK